MVDSIFEKYENLTDEDLLSVTGGDWMDTLTALGNIFYNITYAFY